MLIELLQVHEDFKCPYLNVRRILRNSNIERLASI